MGKIRDSQKKLAVINDLSGFGRCSIAVELPIISAMMKAPAPMPPKNRYSAGCQPQTNCNPSMFLLLKRTAA